MDLIASMFADPNQERTVTIKNKPQKQSRPEAPIDSSSANLPGSVMEMMGIGQPMGFDGQMPMSYPPSDPQALDLYQQGAMPAMGGMPDGSMDPYSMGQMPQGPMDPYSMGGMPEEDGLQLLLKAMLEKGASGAPEADQPYQPFPGILG